MTQLFFTLLCSGSFAVCSKRMLMTILCHTIHLHCFGRCKWLEPHPANHSHTAASLSQRNPVHVTHWHHKSWKWLMENFCHWTQFGWQTWILWTDSQVKKLLTVLIGWNVLPVVFSMRLTNLPQPQGRASYIRKNTPNSCAASQPVVAKNSGYTVWKDRCIVIFYSNHLADTTNKWIIKSCLHSIRCLPGSEDG